MKRIHVTPNISVYRPEGDANQFLPSLGLYEAHDGRLEGIPLWRGLAIANLREFGVYIEQPLVTD